MNHPARVRNAAPTDALTIAHLHAESWRRTYADSMRTEYLEKEVPKERRELWQERFESPDPDQVILVAEVDGNAVGFICAYLEGRGGMVDRGCFIDNLHVLHSHQGRGIGRALLTAVAERTVRDRPGSGMYLSVTRANVEAQAFYRRIGGELAEEGVWAAPDGSEVPILWVVWRDAGVLVPG